MPRPTSSPRAPRDLGRFFVDGPGMEVGDDAPVPRLAPAEVEHALRVLRAAPGDRLEALDGCGGRWPLTVTAVARRALELAPAGAASREPPPGADGSPLPAITVAVAVPRAGRLEPMLDRLTQLGAAAIRPLRCAWTGAGERWPRRERLERVLRAAAKQSGRAWLPRLDDPVAALDWAPDCGAAAAVLHPTAPARLVDWLAQPADARGPVELVIGPEGGFRRDELDALEGRGAAPVRLGVHVLRIETAAEAALAVLVAHRAP